MIYGRIDSPIVDQTIECFREEDFSFVWQEAGYLDVTSYQLVMEVGSTQGADTPLFSLTVGSGITLTGGATPWLATMAFSSAQLTRAAGTYYFTVYKANSGAKRVLSAGVIVLGKNAA
jgi:hypothetical protein